MHTFLDLGSVQQLGDKSLHNLSSQMLLSADSIRHYWENLFQAINLPKGEHDFLSIAVPFCYDCCTRSIIMDILNKQYGMAQCDMIPRPLALLMGYLVQHPQADLCGDLLCVFEEGNSLDYSFIFLNGSVITLEYQGYGSLENLQAAAEQLALYSNRGWEFNHLLYVNSLIFEERYLTEFQSNPAIHLCRAEDGHSTILEGLRYAGPSWALERPRTLRIIYPYDFYLQQYDPLKKNMVLKKIPFDTANLELNLHGSYRIARLSSEDLDSHPETHEVVLAAYEAARISPLPETFNYPPTMVFQGLKENLPDSLEIWLNMAAATITLSPQAQNTDCIAAQSAELQFHLQSSQRDLYKLLESSANHTLKADLLRSISFPYCNKEDCLEKHLEITRLKLYGLLQLWSTK